MRSQTLLRELPYRLEEVVAHAAARRDCSLYQRCRDQVAQSSRNGRRASFVGGVVAHRPSAIERPTTGEDTQPLEQPLLGWRQQPEAPVDRGAQSAVARYD